MKTTTTYRILRSYDDFDADFDKALSTARGCWYSSTFETLDKADEQQRRVNSIETNNGWRDQTTYSLIIEEHRTECGEYAWLYTLLERDIEHITIDNSGGILGRIRPDKRPEGYRGNASVGCEIDYRDEGGYHVVERD